LCRDCALRRVALESARRCPWSADAGLEADIEPRESGSARRRSSRDTPSLPRSESREHESWPGAADSCAPHRSTWRGCGPATVEENSTIPPSPRVVKGLERVAVVIAIKGSRVARSRPTAARMRGRSKAKRLERATREPHNRFRRPIDVDTDSGLVTGYIPRGSLGWSVQLRQRQRGVSDHICGRGRDRRLGQISWSLTPRLPSVSPLRAARRLPCGRTRRPDSPPRNHWLGGRCCSETM
jgi:hypothetical protein